MDKLLQVKSFSWTLINSAGNVLDWGLLSALKETKGKRGGGRREREREKKILPLSDFNELRICYNMLQLNIGGTYFYTASLSCLRFFVVCIRLYNSYIYRSFFSCPFPLIGFENRVVFYKTKIIGPASNSFLLAGSAGTRRSAIEKCRN